MSVECRTNCHCRKCWVNRHCNPFAFFTVWLNLPNMVGAPRANRSGRGMAFWGRSVGHGRTYHGFLRCEDAFVPYRIVICAPPRCRNPQALFSLTGSARLYFVAFPQQSDGHPRQTITAKKSVPTIASRGMYGERAARARPNQERTSRFALFCVKIATGSMIANVSALLSGYGCLDRSLKEGPAMDRMGGS